MDSGAGATTIPTTTPGGWGGGCWGDGVRRGATCGVSAAWRAAARLDAALSDVCGASVSGVSGGEAASGLPGRLIL